MQVKEYLHNVWPAKKVTGYPEILLSDDITPGRLIKWLTEVFARFGNPAVAVTDNGRQFVSDD